MIAQTNRIKVGKMLTTQSSIATRLWMSINAISFIERRMDGVLPHGASARAIALAVDNFPCYFSLVFGHNFVTLKVRLTGRFVFATMSVHNNHTQAVEIVSGDAHYSPSFSLSSLALTFLPPLTARLKCAPRCETVIAPFPSSKRSPYLLWRAS